MQPIFRLLSSTYRSGRVWLLGVGLLMSLLSPAQTILYVTPDGQASADAAVSWASSTTDLQGCTGYLAGHGGGQVWIKRGLYKTGGAINTNRSLSFQLQNGVTIYGGFVGNETSLSQRPVIDPVNGLPSSTTLSGEIGDPGTTNDNAFNVFYNPSFYVLNSSAVLDGVVITGGHAQGLGDGTIRVHEDENRLYTGGGIFNVGAPIIRNCLLTNNYALQGGAVFASNVFYYENTGPQLFINCVFDNNQAYFGGGGIYNNQVAYGLFITNCVFRNNSAGEGGGGIYNATYISLVPGATYPKITNCLFEQNRARFGGAMYNGFSNLSDPRVTLTCSPFLTKCNFVNNTAGLGGAIYNNVTNINTGYGGSGEVSPLVVNCLFQANSAGGGGGAIQTDLFTNEMPMTYNPVFINVSFLSNTASGSGGALGIDVYESRFAPGTTHSQSKLTNCTFHNNSAPRGAAIDINAETPGRADVQHTLINCVLFGNGGSNAFSTLNSYPLNAPTPPTPTLTNSLLETAMIGYNPGPGLRFTATSPFESADSGELKASSEAIDGGNNTVYGSPYTLLVDVAGKPRFYNTTIDMGAYEYRGAPVCLPESAFVTPNGAGDLSGSNWANALPASSFPLRLANSCPRSSFYVARGLYTPTSGTDRSASFLVPDGVRIFGGYAGVGPTPDARTGFPASTTLSGDIGRPGDPSDNSYHVVKILNGGSQTQLNGLLITGGLANGGGEEDTGGGVYIRGTGIQTLSSPRLVNVAIQGNQASQGGGGLFSRISYTGTSSPSLLNVSLQANSASQGGALYISSDGEGCKGCDREDGPNFGATDMALTNVSISQNSATQGGAVFFTYQNYPGSAQLLRITNSILFGNGSNPINKASSSTIPTQYSLLEQGSSNYTDGGNTTLISQSPFVSPASQQLGVGSPAINSGSNASYSAVSGPLLDLALTPRIQGGTIDMGAFELAPDLTTLLYALPSTAYGTTPVTLVIEVTELNAVTTGGLTTVHLSKDALLSLSLNPALSVVGGRQVQNSQWSLDSSDPDFYLLTTTQPVVGGRRLSVGLSGELRPGRTKGSLTISGTVGNSLGESSLSNNTDSDKVDYFQK